MSPPEPSEHITACIVCRNEGDKIGPALESVQWVDEVLVLDLDSSDDSAEVARSHGARVLGHSPVPIVELVRNEVAAEAAGDWILVLDPDERVSPGLAAQLAALRPRRDIDAVVVPRMNVDLGFAPSSPLHRFEPQVRMYRRSRVQWPRFPNALPSVPEERLHRVPARDDLVLVHERSRNIPEVLDRVLRYAPAQAQAMADAGRVFTADEMISTLAEKIEREFIRGQPWRDGVPGVLRAGIIVTFHFYVWAAFWQASAPGRTERDDRVIRRLGRLADGGWRLLRIAARARRHVGRSRRPWRAPR